MKTINFLTMMSITLLASLSMAHQSGMSEEAVLLADCRKGDNTKLVIADDMFTYGRVIFSFTQPVDFTAIQNDTDSAIYASRSESLELEVVASKVEKPNNSQLLITNADGGTVSVVKILSKSTPAQPKSKPLLQIKASKLSPKDSKKFSEIVSKISAVRWDKCTFKTVN